MGAHVFPHSEPCSHLPPSPIPWVVPEHQLWESCFMHPTCTGHLFYIWEYTCFNAILSNHPTLAFSHILQKSVLYICVSFVAMHVGSWLPVFLDSISSVQSLSLVRLFATPRIAARQTSMFITFSRSSLKLMSIELVIPSSHLILCRPLLLLPPIPPSIRVFSNESTLRMRWPKYWIPYICVNIQYFLCFPIYFPWSDGTRPWSSFSECWTLSQLFHSPLSLSSRGFLVPLHFLP